MNVNLKLRKGAKRGQAVIMVIIFSALMMTGLSYQNVAADADTGEWTLKATYAKAFTDYGWAYSKQNNKLYYFGGKELSMGGVATSETTSYDPVTNQFKKLGNNPYNCVSPTAVEMDNYMYVAAGRLLYRFDLKNESWETQYDNPRWHQQSLENNQNVNSMAAIDGKLYLFGQTDGSDRKAVYEFQPTLDGGKWTRKTDMPEEKQFSSAIEYKGKIYVYGGESSAGVKSNTIYAYDPKSDEGYGTDSKNAWKQLTSAHYAKSSYAWTVKYGAIYIIGGNKTNTVEAYSIKADQWVDMPSANSSWIGAAFAPVELDYNKNYVEADNKIYTLEDNKVEVLDLKDDHPNTYSSRNVKLELYKSYTGEISYPGDVDVFTYSPSASRNVYIKMTAVNKKTGESEPLSLTIDKVSGSDSYPSLYAETLLSGTYSNHCTIPFAQYTTYYYKISHPKNGVDGYTYKIELGDIPPYWYVDD